MRGIMNGMVMQRGADNTADILLITDTALGAVTYTGERCGEASLTPVEGGYRLRGIPVGGPYTVTVGGETYTDIYVGDVTVLAGQSNMQGVGWYRPQDRVAHSPQIRALFMENEWRPACHPLHSEWKAYDAVHTAVLGAKKPDTDFQGVGPGIGYAERLYALTGVPQGLLCSAHGGTSSRQWSPSIKDRGPSGSLYAAMERRVRDNGSHIRAVFWFQGCADAFEDDAPFEAETKAIIEAIRTDFAYPGEGPIPFLQVQLGRVVHKKLPSLEPNWVKIRELQRRMAEELPQVYTLSSITTELDDLIHISGPSHDRLGAEAAECLHTALGGTPCLPPPPKLGEVHLYRHPLSGWATIDVTFENLIGGLRAEGRASGFLVAPPNTEPSTDTVYSVILHGNTARLRLHYLPEEIVGQVLYYGYGLNPYANLTDEGDRAIPCFGPLLLDAIEEDYII